MNKGPLHRTQEAPRPSAPPKAKIRVPGSKSITQRALVAAALASGTSVLRGALDSEDTLLLRNALRETGIGIKENGTDWSVEGRSGRILPVKKDLYMGNNGTGLRFLASVVSLGRGTYRLTGAARMSERPIEPLLEALGRWGVTAGSIEGTGCPPVEITTRGIAGGKTTLKAAKSSQFLSSLLLVGPYCDQPADIILDGPLVSRPYVDLTLEIMKAFGIEVKEEGGGASPTVFTVPRGTYRALTYDVEGDASSASYFWAAAAITGGTVTVANIPEHALQGDARFADILAEMGCTVTKGIEGVTVKGPSDGRLKPVDIDMSRWPDVVPTLAAVAVYADGTSHIKNVAHLRIKETDRLKAVAAELSRMGARVDELEDGLTIHGGRSLHGATIETYDDHRIAMAFAVAGLRVPGLLIRDPDCVRKSFPSFWKAWKDVILP